MAALLLHLQPQLQELTPSQVVGTMWALGRLGVTPPPAWMHRMYACTPPQLGQLRGDEAAVLLRGLARMQVRSLPRRQHCTRYACLPHCIPMS